jgi:vitamin B12 transporter
VALSRFRRQITLFTGSLLLAAKSISAEVPPGATAPPEPPATSVTPPRPLEILDADYPSQARANRQEAVLVLRLTLDAQGQVTAAEVVERSADGFDEAARAALLRSRFTPATRSGQAVAAKILYRYEFRLSPEPSPPASPPPPPAATAGFPGSPGPTVASVASLPAESTGPSEVTVEGERSEAEAIQRSAAPVTVLDLSRHQKRSSDLGEIMARTFGVSVRRAGGLGSDTRFSLNGLQKDQIRFFINAIPVEHSFPFEIASIPVNLLERVEIYRGVVPVRYASDALGGAINFVTDQTFDTRIAGAYELGSFGTRRAHLLARYRDEESGFALGIESFVDGAKNDYEVDVEVPDERGRLRPATVPRFHDRYRAYGIAVDAGVTDVPWARRLILRATRVAYDKQLQNNLVMTVPYGEVEYGASLDGLQLHFEHDLTPKLGLEARASYSDVTIDFSDRSAWVYDWFGRRLRERRIHGEIESDPTDQTIWVKAAFGRVGAAYRFSGEHRLLFATSSDFSTRTGDERLQADPDARDPLTAMQVLFKQASGIEYELGAFKSSGRARFEDSAGRVEHVLQNLLFLKSYLYRVDSEEPLPGGVFRERDQNRHRFGIGDGIRVLFSDSFYAKASYELATRLPRGDEVFGDGLLVHGNLELTPEVSDNANAGARMELEESPVGGLMLDVNAFYRDTRDQIVLLGNDRFFMHQNLYRATSLGLEGAFEWISPWRPFACDGSFTWIEQRNRSDDGAFKSFAGDRIPNRPWLQAAFGARVRLPRVFDRRDELEPFYTALYVHEYYRGWESVGIRQFKQVIPSQLIHGAGVTYTVRRGLAAAWTTLEVQNLTDQKAYEFYGQERPGRAFYVKVTAASR